MKQGVSLGWALSLIINIRPGWKCPSLLQTFINYGHKKFKTLGSDELQTFPE